MSIQLSESIAEIDQKFLPVLPTTTSPDRPLPILCIESTRARWIWLLVAAIVVSIYGFKTLSYWAPADGGVDQNAYLLGGRMIAEHFSTRYTLPNPYAYVGGMMIRTSKLEVMGGDYYPKYPLGLPLLYASFFWIFGATKAAKLAFLVSPVCSILAVAGMFFLGRVMAGSFAGLMAAILLGTSELTIELSNNPNSHASCLAFIVWGMYFLVKWWQTPAGFFQICLGLLGGFLIGYAGLIRYSEGLLVLAVGVAVLTRWPWDSIKSYRSISVWLAMAAAVYFVMGQTQSAHPAAAVMPWTALHHSVNILFTVILLAIATTGIIFCVTTKNWKEASFWLAALIAGLAVGGSAFLLAMQLHSLKPTVIGSEPAWTSMHLIANTTGAFVLFICATVALIFCLIRNNRQDWKMYFLSIVPGLAWAVPIATMLIYNKLSMGNWTGYDSTNESEGFTWLKFKETWEQMLRTYYDTAAFFVLPMGLAGIFIAFGRSWKLGLMLLFWLVPGSLLYTSYYWSPDRGISYARFFLVYLPAVMLGVAICFSDAIMAPVRESHWYLKLPRVAAILVVVGIAASLGVYRSVHGLQQGLGGNGFGNGGSQSLAEQQHVRQNLAQMGQVLLKHVPANAVLFVDSSSGGRGGGNERPLNYIQFLRHWDAYSSDAFEATRQSFGGGAGAMANMLGGFNGPGNNANQPNNDPNPVPTTRQKLQSDYEAMISSKPLSERRKYETTAIDSALKEGRGVFSLGVATNDTDMRRMFNLVGKYSFVVLETWSDLPPLPPDPVTENSGNTNGRNRGGIFGGGGGGGGNGGRRGNGGGGAGAGGRRGGTLSTGENAIKWELLQIRPAT